MNRIINELKGPFSIAMLNYQRVNLVLEYFTNQMDREHNRGQHVELGTWKG